MRRRDNRALAAATVQTGGGLADLAKRIGAAAAELELTLLRVAATHGGTEQAVDAVRGDIRHHMLGPLLVAAANDEPLDLADTLDAILDIYRAGWRDERIEIVLDRSLPAGLVVDRARRARSSAA